MAKPKKKQKIILLAKPKTMSEALLAAVANAKFHITHGTYLDDEYINKEGEQVEGELRGCAKGAMYAMLVPWRTAIQAAADEMDDESMIEVICRKVKGACDIVPWQVWRKHVLKARTPKASLDSYKRSYESYIEECKEDNVEPEEYRWVDLCETLFEQRKKDFQQIAAILKEYGR